MKLFEISNVIDHGSIQIQPPAVAYHLTLESRAPSILSKGLLVGRGNANYQYKHPAVFLLTQLSADALDRVGSVVMSGGRSAEQMEDPNAVFENIVVLEVDLHGFKGPVFQDTSQRVDGAIFVTQSIEPNRIKMKGQLDFASLEIK